MPITTAKELGNALKNRQKTLVIEGKDLVKKVLRIKNTGTIAWGIAIGGLMASVAAAIAAPAAGGPPILIHVITVPTTATVLGGATGAALAIAVAAGGVASLNSLRKYKIVEQQTDRLVLERR